MFIYIYTYIIYIYVLIYILYIGGLIGDIYIYIYIHPKKLQFAAYGQFVLVILLFYLGFLRNLEVFRLFTQGQRDKKIKISKEERKNANTYYLYNQSMSSLFTFTHFGEYLVQFINVYFSIVLFGFICHTGVWSRHSTSDSHFKTGDSPLSDQYLTCVK